MKKMDIARETLLQNLPRFICPICAKAFRIAKMTPLLHNSADDKQKILDSGLTSLSCDFNILLGYAR